jgi:hypothetical protein
VPTEKDLIKRLIQELQNCEVEMKCLGFALAAMRTSHPEFPALELLEEARQHRQFQIDVQERYKPLLEAMEKVDIEELLKILPRTKYSN